MQQPLYIFAARCLLFALCLPLSAVQLEGRAFVVQGPQVKQKDVKQPPASEPEDSILISWNSCGLIPSGNYEGATSQTGTTRVCSHGMTLYFVVDHCVGAHGAEKELQRQLQRKEVERVDEVGGRSLVTFSEPIALTPEIPRHSQLRCAYIWIEENNVLGIYGPTSEHVMELYHANPAQFLLHKKQ